MIDRVKAEAFDAEANAIRPGWTIAPDTVSPAGDGSELWMTIIRGHIGQVWQSPTSRGWCWMVLDGSNPSRIFIKGVASRRGWAMDACETETPQGH